MKQQILCAVVASLYIVTTLNLTACDNQADLNSKSNSNDDATDNDTPQDNQTFNDPTNIKKELVNLFSLEIDKDKDGLASFAELREYLVALDEKTTEYNIDKRWLSYSPQIHEVFSWEGYEPERKEVLTWEQYFNQTYPDLTEDDVGIPLRPVQDTSKISITSADNPELAATPANSAESSKASKASKIIEDEKDPDMKTLKLMVHRADARWKLADSNGDTFLTRDEFKYLWHPEEGSAELKALYVKEATEDIDSNMNSKIELNEFMDHLKEMAPDQETNEAWILSQKGNFEKILDKNGDGHMDEDEIKAWLIPEKNEKFELEAKRYLDIGDKNHDFHLSQIEVADNYDTFMQLMPPDYFEYSDEEEEEDADSSSIVEQPVHDEL